MPASLYNATAPAASQVPKRRIQPIHVLAYPTTSVAPISFPAGWSPHEPFAPITCQRLARLQVVHDNLEHHYVPKSLRYVNATPSDSHDSYAINSDFSALADASATDSGSSATPGSAAGSPISTINHVLFSPTSDAVSSVAGSSPPQSPARRHTFRIDLTPISVNSDLDILDDSTCFKLLEAGRLLSRSAPATILLLSYMCNSLSCPVFKALPSMLARYFKMSRVVHPVLALFDCTSWLGLRQNLVNLLGPHIKDFEFTCASFPKLFPFVPVDIFKMPPGSAVCAQILNIFKALLYVMVKVRFHSAHVYELCNLSFDHHYIPLTDLDSVPITDSLPDCLDAHRFTTMPNYAPSVPPSPSDDPVNLPGLGFSQLTPSPTPTDSRDLSYSPVSSAFSFFENSPPLSVPLASQPGQPAPRYAFLPWGEIPAVAAMLAEASGKSFSPALLRRISLRYLREQSNSMIPPKHFALDFQEMITVDCESGESPLDPTEVGLSGPGLLSFHKLAHPNCTAQCGIWKLARICTHGYLPTLAQQPCPSRSATSNAPSVAKFQDHVHARIDKMLASGAIRECSPRGKQLASLIVVVRSQEQYYARAHCNVDLDSSVNLNIVNTYRASQNLPPFKPRLVFNQTGNGLNDCIFCPSFTQPTIHDFASNIEPDDIILVLDIERYFELFALAKEFRRYVAFAVKRNGRIRYYKALRYLFGGKSGPRLGWTYAAHLHWCFTQLKIRHFVIQDDHAFFCRDDENRASTEAYVRNTFSLLGLPISDDKRQASHEVVYIGFLVNTKLMAISPRPETVRAFLYRFTPLLRFLFENGAIPPVSELESLRGSMVNFAQCIQRGLTEISPFSQLIHSYPCYTLQQVADLKESTTFWQETLHPWAEGTVVPRWFPIFNRHTIENDPSTVYCLCMDASGLDDHGVGVLEGVLTDDNPVGRTISWSDSTAGARMGRSSFNNETQLYPEWAEATLLRNKIVFIFTDSMDLAYAINKGNCADLPTRVFLNKMFTAGDVKSLYFVAIWLSRDHPNIQLVDLFSHLSAYLGRSAVGEIDDLLASAHDCGLTQGGIPPRTNDSAVSPILREDNHNTFSANVRVNRELLPSNSGTPQGLRQVNIWHEVPPPRPLHFERNSLAFNQGPISAQTLNQAAQIPGHDSTFAEGTNYVRSVTSTPSPLIGQPTTEPPRGTLTYGLGRPPPHIGTYSQSHSGGHSLGSLSTPVPSTSLSFQNSTFGQRRMDSIPGQDRPIGIQSSPCLLPVQQSWLQPQRVTLPQSIPNEDSQSDISRMVPQTNQVARY